MAWRFRADGDIGKAALYTVPAVDSTDDAPLTDPRSHLSRVRFHTDFKYPRIVSDTTYSLTLPSRSQGTRGEATHTLGAHGLGITPFCLGAVQYVGHWSPLFISTPLYYAPQTVESSITRLISLGADATNILLHEYWVIYDIGSSGAYTAPAQSINVRVLVTDEAL